MSNQCQICQFKCQFNVRSHICAINSGKGNITCNLRVFDISGSVDAKIIYFKQRKKISNWYDSDLAIELTLELTDLTLIWHRTLDLIVRSKCQIKYQFNFKNNYFILQKIFWLNWYSNWPIWPKQIDRLLRLYLWSSRDLQKCTMKPGSF